MTPREQWTPDQYEAHRAAIRAELGIPEGRPVLADLAELVELGRMQARYTDTVTPDRTRVGLSA